MVVLDLAGEGYYGASTATAMWLCLLELRMDARFDSLCRMARMGGERSGLVSFRPV
jgi:hypothetical protein